MRVLKVGILSCAVLLSVIGGGASNAATIQNFDSGWYTNSGFTAGVTNVNVGSSNLSGAVYHNWLAFNVTGLANDMKKAVRNTISDVVDALGSSAVVGATTCGISQKVFACAFMDGDVLGPRASA
jgi:hypothetical protein